MYRSCHQLFIIVLKICQIQGKRDYMSYKQNKVTLDWKQTIKTIQQKKIRPATLIVFSFTNVLMFIQQGETKLQQGSKLYLEAQNDQQKIANMCLYNMYG